MAKKNEGFEIEVLDEHSEPQLQGPPKPPRTLLTETLNENKSGIPDHKDALAQLNIQVDIQLCV